MIAAETANRCERSAIQMITESASDAIVSCQDYRIIFAIPPRKTMWITTGEMRTNGGQMIRRRRNHSGNKLPRNRERNWQGAS